MDLIRESFHRCNAAIRERCLLIMEVLSGVYEHIEKMQKKTPPPVLQHRRAANKYKYSLSIGYFGGKIK